MTIKRALAGIVFVASLAASAGAFEAGPLVFNEPSPAGGRVSGFRPFYVHWTDASGGTEETTVLYPLFYYRTYRDTYAWAIFQFVQRYGVRRPGSPGVPPGPSPEARTFDLWPFWFSRTSPRPEENYRALFPIAGTVQDKFVGFEKISFVLFPFYVRGEKRGAIITATPWPFVRVTRGAERGFALWPLYVEDDRPGYWSRRFYLWPFGWRVVTQPNPWDPPGTPPSRTVGALPFYAADHEPGLDSVDFAWPFFGYTNRTSGAPRYREVRYFWPFLVQGRGAARYKNRWAPFYSHSVAKGMDKLWVAWPLYRRMRWTEGRIVNTKTSLLYFAFWKGEERKASDPAAAPAYKLHVWPLVSVWDNGAGRREWEAPSLFQVFFPNNREMLTGYDPITALVRHRVDPDGSTQTSLLWNMVSWRTKPAAGRREVRLGPWRVFSMAFSPRTDTVTRTARRP